MNSLVRIAVATLGHCVPISPQMGTFFSTTSIVIYVSTAGKSYSSTQDSAQIKHNERFAFWYFKASDPRTTSYVPRGALTFLLPWQRALRLSKNFLVLRTFGAGYLGTLGAGGRNVTSQSIAF